MKVLLLIGSIVAIFHATFSVPISYGPKRNTPENSRYKCKNYSANNKYLPLVAVIESGIHKQKIEELSGQFEGDIVLTREQEQAIFGISERTGLINTTFRWPENTIPYLYTTDLNDAQQEEVEKGLRAIEAAAPCLTFVKRTTEEDYVEVTVSIKKPPQNALEFLKLKKMIMSNYYYRVNQLDVGQWSVELLANKH